MAGDHDRHGILAHCLADIAGAFPAGQPEFFGKLAIGHSATGADLAQRRVEFLAEVIDAAEIDGDSGEINRLTS